MVLRLGQQLSQLVTRRFSTSVVRGGIHHGGEGLPGSNMPFDINNRYKLAGVFIMFFGSGLLAPVLLVRHQLLKD